MTLAAWGILLGIIVTILGFLGMIYRLGKAEQKIANRFDNLEKAQLEDRSKMLAIGEKLDAHVTEDRIHINPLLDQRTYEEQRDWRRNVNEKLDKLLLKDKT